jgi:predicted nuclease of predicted toxin-antitoxin system
LIFVIDENLSPKLVPIHKGQAKAIHINQLKPTKKAVIKDDLIRKLSLEHRFVLVTKDDDFVKSWVDRKVPDKLIYIFDNFDDMNTLLISYQEHFPLLENLIACHDFIEFSSGGIRTPFDIPIPYKRSD